MTYFAIKRNDGTWREWFAPANTPIVTKERQAAVYEARPGDKVVKVSVTITEIKRKRKGA